MAYGAHAWMDGSVLVWFVESMFYPPAGARSLSLHAIESRGRRTLKASISAREMENVDSCVGETPGGVDELDVAIVGAGCRSGAGGSKGVVDDAGGLGFEDGFRGVTRGEGVHVERTRA